MTRKKLLLDQSSTVAIDVEGDDPVWVRLGNDDNGVTLIGTLADLHRIVIEIDRQLSQKVIRL